MRSVTLAVVIALSFAILQAMTAGSATRAAPRTIIVEPPASTEYPAGWNIVSGPDGMRFPGCSGTLFTFQAGDAAYEASQNTAGVAGGRGYWCYFAYPTTVSLQGADAESRSFRAPAGQFILIGNPSGSDSMTISGADVVYAFDPTSNGYQSASRLEPGHGAWAMSRQGGTIAVATAGPAGVQVGGVTLPPGGSVTIGMTASGSVIILTGAPVVTVPGTPRAPANLRATVEGRTSIRLDWSGSSDDISGYRIYDALTNTQVKSVEPGTTSFTLVRLEPGSDYCMVVYAYNNVGLSSSSNEVCVTTQL